MTVESRQGAAGLAENRKRMRPSFQAGEASSQTTMTDSQSGQERDTTPLSEAANRRFVEGRLSEFYQRRG